MCRMVLCLRGGAPVLSPDNVGLHLVNLHLLDLHVKVEPTGVDHGA